MPLVLDRLQEGWRALPIKANGDVVLPGECESWHCVLPLLDASAQDPQLVGLFQKKSGPRAALLELFDACVGVAVPDALPVVRVPLRFSHVGKGQKPKRLKDVARPSWRQLVFLLILAESALWII